MNSLFRYTIADNIDAFSTERGAELPYYVVQPHQVHGCEIREVTDPLTTRDELEGVDALVTDVPGVAISVRTADCIPVLLYDPVNKAIAAVHAGWSISDLSSVNPTHVNGFKSKNPFIKLYNLLDVPHLNLPSSK